MRLQEESPAPHRAVTATSVQHALSSPVPNALRNLTRLLTVEEQGATTDRARLVIYNSFVTLLVFREHGKWTVFMKYITWNREVNLTEVKKDLKQSQI